MSDQENFENPQDDENSNEQFVMLIEDIFVIKGRGVVVVGHLQSGIARKGDSVTIVGGDKPEITTKIAGLDMHGSVLLRNVNRDQIEIGMIVKGEVV